MNREAELIKYTDDVIIQQIYIRCNDQSDITEKDAMKIYWTTTTILASASKCKNVKIHLQLPPKLQRSKASNYHQQITIMENWKIQYTLTTTCFHLKHTIGTRNFLTNEFINIINNNVINHLITLHIINNFQEEIEAKRKIQHFLQYHQTQQIQLGNDYLRK